jgi:hypothetical protein
VNLFYIYRSLPALPALRNGGFSFMDRFAIRNGGFSFMDRFRDIV